MKTKLFAVVPIYKNRLPNRKATREGMPRLDLLPMDHQSACNWMRNCRNKWTDYRLIEWPGDVAWLGDPVTT